MMSASGDLQSQANIDPKKLAFGSLSGLLAFGFGSGLSPVAPGTMGTLAAIPFAIPLRSLGTPGYWLVLIFLFFLGVAICKNVSQKLGLHDHGGIVWDEMVGYWLCIAFVPMQWQWLLAAFVLFRIFDILKPWPISSVDKNIPGGFGIMIDDIIAAIFTLILLGAIQYFY